MRTAAAVDGLDLAHSQGATIVINDYVFSLEKGMELLLPMKAKDPYERAERAA
jgi:hypothetical protein